MCRQQDHVLQKLRNQRRLQLGIQFCKEKQQLFHGQIDDNSPKCTQPGTHGEITILGEKKWCGTHDQEVMEHSQGVTQVLPANLHHKTQLNS